MKCGHCGTDINLNSRKAIYRTCDAYVCSPMCSIKRIKVISSLDPNLSECIAWTNIKTITPPKTLSKKLSYIALCSLTDDLEDEIEDTPLNNVQNRYALYDQTQPDDNVHYKAPTARLLCEIGVCLTIIYLTAITIGASLLVS